MRIAFVWDGVRLHYGKRFSDGLYMALKHLKQRHDIRMFEPTEEQAIHGFRPDVILYWAALCENLKPLVASYPYKKAICFAGGPIEEGNVDGFDLYFTESRINELEFQKLGKPWMRAFGVNEAVFRPQHLPKKYDAAFWGSFAAWKRPGLFAESVGDRGVWVGQKQDHEPECYQVCEVHGVETHDELLKTDVLHYINSAHVALNTANYWGGGQRMTLEAMACNIPPIVMNDSLKNIEYVDESGWGRVVEPNPEAIRGAIADLKGKECNARDYIMSKYTSKHYAQELEAGLTQL